MLQKLSMALFFVFFNFQSVHSQNSINISPSKNAIHASFGTIGISFSAHIGYDRFIKSSNGFFKSYYASAKVGGIASLDFSGANSGTGQTFSAGITALTGNGDKHFEVGLGLGYYHDTEIPEFDTSQSTFYPNFNIGYRLQKPNGFLFRTGIGLTEWAYLGFGYNF